MERWSKEKVLVMQAWGLEFVPLTPTEKLGRHSSPLITPAFRR